MSEGALDSLTDFLIQIPAIEPGIDRGTAPDGLWWVKFSIDIHHPLAWQVVQELGHVVNYLSVNERLPTTFYPVSPPPYLNGGPAECLAWVIEAKQSGFAPATLKQWLEGRLPRPVNDLSQWATEEEDED
ncbi:hypothetical protein EJV47_07250 [Hymenobacter gummosus]|uniref:Uncharacterized protein n=1 Tax=Hymenobacter gummosus TaxID=1776032 RepID=A0A431U5Z6_9BACT|nr:hypothetical protein [Hymenobacter gummosus]RTQ51588.1 hypothetical protein EJV47_07250 [Hymenobacter gummosus]